jgi:integrase
MSSTPPWHIKDLRMQSDLRQLHREFMDYSEFARQLAGDTLRCYNAAFDLLMKRYPDLLPPMITPGLLSDFFKWLQTRERPLGRGIRRGVKKSTIATYWRKLSKFFSWLEGKGVIEANPLRSKQMEFPTVRYDDKKYLNRKQMEQILLAVSIGIPWKNEFVRSRNLALISVAVNCGLRKGELLALRVADIDWKGGMLTVQGETSKSRSSRRIPLKAAFGRISRSAGKENMHRTVPLGIGGNEQSDHRGGPQVSRPGRSCAVES